MEVKVAMAPAMALTMAPAEGQNVRNKLFSAKLTVVFMTEPT